MYDFRSGTIECNNEAMLLDNNLIFTKKTIVLSHRNHLHINSANQNHTSSPQKLYPLIFNDFHQFTISSSAKLYLGNSSGNKCSAQRDWGTKEF